MKKILVLALSALMAMGVLAGCRGNVGIETSKPAGSSSQSTTQATTQSTTQSTTQATTRPTMPSTSTPGTDGAMTPGTEGTQTGRGRVMPPRY